MRFRFLTGDVNWETYGSHFHKEATMSHFQHQASAIAGALGDGWARLERGESYDQGCAAWVEFKSAGYLLFISNTWVGKGRLYIGGSFPTGYALPYGKHVPSITVDPNKSPERIAQDITRRLLPEYSELLAEVVKRKAEAEAFEAGRAKLAQEVAEIIGGKINGELVYSEGWEFQVTNPTGFRVYGNCNHLTLEQLKRIKDVCPELFEERS